MWWEAYRPHASETSGEGEGGGGVEEKEVAEHRQTPQQQSLVSNAPIVRGGWGDGCLRQP